MYRKTTAARDPQLSLCRFPSLHPRKLYHCRRLNSGQTALPPPGIDSRSLHHPPPAPSPPRPTRPVAWPDSGLPRPSLAFYVAVEHRGRSICHPRAPSRPTLAGLGGSLTLREPDTPSLFAGPAPHRPCSSASPRLVALLLCPAIDTSKLANGETPLVQFVANGCTYHKGYYLLMASI